MKKYTFLIVAIIVILVFLVGKYFDFSFKESAYLQQVTIVHPHTHSQSTFGILGTGGTFGCINTELFEENNGKGKSLLSSIPLSDEYNACIENIYQYQDVLHVQICYERLESGCKSVVLAYNPITAEWSKVAQGIPAQMGTKLGWIHLYNFSQHNQQAPDSQKHYTIIRKYFQERFGVDIGEFHSSL